MSRNTSLILAMLATSAVLAGCAEGASLTAQPTGTGAGGGGGAGGESSGGQGGAGGSAPACGDGLLAAGEGCDDGNADAGDGCDAGCAIEAGYQCAGEPSDCMAVCGDGLLAGAETCDDGDKDAGDGCSAGCAEEPGYVCSGEPSACVTVCGDGIIAGDELCDDGNADPLDGCDGACLVEHGFTCTGQPSACATTCGDGVAGGAETCDDGNVDPADGCSAECGTEEGYACSGEPSACATVCGDGIVAGAETCDDLGAQPGDGCSDQCGTETGYLCIGEPSICATVCGDGIVVGAEACDDAGLQGGDGCDATCGIETGYACGGEPSTCGTVCGDALIVGAETCDDGGSASGDGCSATCLVEPGFTCMGLPSACVTTCGDGFVAGAEACDDGNLTNGDGCSATCTVQIGYSCSGTPSACVTVCGDGILAGSEGCDDGNTVNGDGCSSLCVPHSGESCAEPLVMAQATQVSGKYTWNVASGSVTVADGEWSCDPNGVGPDVVARYTKSSDTLANGGKLLHVKADTPASSTTTYYVNLEIMGGACDAAGTSHKCTWYKDNWDAYLDVPPGDYWIWVSKNGAGTPFPQVTIVAEEVNPSAAEGEGCFAPYTSSSANYTPPGGAGMPHTWTIIDGAINSFDMSATWGEPESVSCDNHATYGDITGVDAVIQYNKVSPTSVLKIDVQNTDPVLTQSDLDIEVLSVCDSGNPAKISRHCRADKDLVSITAPSPVGPVYLWLATEATSEELQGAAVQVTEIFPGVGESWPTAEPLPVSGAITPTSTQRLDAPSCFPAGGNIHWYSYTLVNEAFSLAANAAGHVGVYDEGGQELGCVASAAAGPFSMLGTPGQTVYIAVQSPSTISNLVAYDFVYSGIQGNATDMQFVWTTSPASEYSMAINANQIVVGDTIKVWSFPKVVGGGATEYGSAYGITTAHMGYDITFAGASLFSVDTNTVGTSNRLFRIYDGATWGPGTAWDLNPSYPASSPAYSITTDGSLLFMATRKTSVDTSFYSFSPAAAGAPNLLGVSTSVWYVVGLAADSTYFYVASDGVSGEGVYRVLRSNIAAPAVKIATIDTGTIKNNIEVDSYATAQNVYVRDYNGDVHAVAAPAGAGPVHVGVISTLGTTADYAMAYDQAGAALYMWESETVSPGRFVKLQ